MQLQRIDRDTQSLHSELWAAVRTAAAADPSPVAALAVAGMNDVLNAQGYTQAAWRNRIPLASWALMSVIALICNLLLGLGAHENQKVLLLVMPLAVAIAFFLIADIDSPRGGPIRVAPENLVALSATLPP